MKLARPKSTARQLERITREMYHRNHELVETNKTLSLLRSIDTLVLESQGSMVELCNQIAEAITATAGYPFTAILGQPNVSAKKLEVLGYSTPGSVLDEGLVQRVETSAEGSWFKSTSRSQALVLSHIGGEKIAPFLGITTAEADSLKEKLPVKSIFATKLIARKGLVGVLVVGFNDYPHNTDGADERLIERLGEAVGIALDNKLLFEENQKVLADLRRANNKLKVLDQTKDEFISMASHQLRTPLTTIKGYLSMVLEGDAGSVKKEEKDMLEKAFSSASGMVYLIADLLNVSRLQSGKFVIDNKPTDLAAMVETEVAQLQTAAKNHRVTLSFKKPDKFPLANLDETKIRQVVMNFIDNAVYYTPAGGHIEVALEATPKAINYTVVDNGLGVPKGEQAHLFSKFYRAANAKKERPDGTGLGLFMAKKVIVAEGGAIIFKSTEGKGSTFGFTFPLSKVKVKEK